MTHPRLLMALALFVIVAFLASVFVGYAGLDVAAALSDVLHGANSLPAIVLVDIAVAGAFRQKGIASRLIKQLQSESAAAGVPLELRVDRSNTNALSLYQKHGLEIKGEDQIQFLMTWEGHRR